MRHVLGVDIGTTAIKAAVFGEDGTLKGSHTREYPLSTPAAAMVELDGEVYIHAFASAVREAVGRSGIHTGDIASMAISAQGETLFFLDDRGNPLRPAIVWMDNRATEQSDRIEAALGRETIHRTTGQVAMSAAWPAAKILWVREHQLQVYRQTAKYLLIEDYFLYLLTGRFVSEDSLLCSTMYWDINTRQYWPEMLELLGITGDQLPEILPPGTPVGRVTAEAAMAFGLDTGTLVCLGALDQACGAIGVGNVRPGIFSESTGAALATVAMTDHVVLDPAGEMPCFASGIGGMYMIHSFSTGGMVMRWFRDTFCETELVLERQGKGNSYSSIDKLAAGVPPGCDGLRMIPHLQGSGPPDSSSHAKGAFLGVTLAHTRAHFARAIMEGVTMVLCRMMEATCALDVEINEIRSLSGGAKSNVWCQIKADATGIPVRTMETTENAACLGAAILAGVGAGIWSSVAETAQDLACYSRQFQPDPGNKRLYSDMLTGYKLLMAELDPQFRRTL